MKHKFSKTKKVYLPMRRGFSMIELLIVVAIMVIMTGAIFVSRNNGKAASDVEVATRQVAAQIRALQNEALNGKQIGGLNACSYKFDSINGALTYSASYYSDCATASIIGSAQSFNLSNKGNVKVSTSPAGGASFYFKAPQGVLSPAATHQIILESKNQPTTKASICIYGSGNIVEKKDASAC